MNKDKNTVSIDGGILTTLQIVFLVLKLAGLVDWSWWFVFLPGIISIVLIGILITIMYYYYKK